MKFLNTLIFGLVILLQSFLVFSKAHWFFELWTHYLHYIVLFDVFAILILLIQKKWAWTLLPLLFLQINLWPLVPYLQKETPPITEPEMSILMSNFFYLNEELEDFKMSVTAKDPDLIIIHEASEIWEDALDEDIYPFQELTEVKGIPGIFMASKTPGEISEIVLGNALGLEFKNEDYTVLAVHPFPAFGKTWQDNALSYFEDMEIYAKANPEAILIGDFNATPWSPKMKNLLSETKLKDASLGFGFLTTWHNTNPLFKIPIDHALVSKNIQVHYFETLKVKGSDHKAIMLKVSN